MNVQSIVLHITGVEVLRKGEEQLRTLFCPFSTHPSRYEFPSHADDGNATCCGPWCPHFGDVSQKVDFKSGIAKGWYIGLTCGGAPGAVCIETDDPDGLRDLRCQEKGRELI